jgi:hypothetical protein
MIGSDRVESAKDASVDWEEGSVLVLTGVVVTKRAYDLWLLIVVVTVVLGSFRREEVVEVGRRGLPQVASLVLG